MTTPKKDERKKRLLKRRKSGDIEYIENNSIPQVKPKDGKK